MMLGAKILDMTGKPCPIPVAEAKKALANVDTDCILVIVDNIIATENLEKLAKGYGFQFSRADKGGLYEVAISKSGKTAPSQAAASSAAVSSAGAPDTSPGGLVVVISRDTMGEGNRELGKILIKGFLYSLTELKPPPKYLIFLNSGARLTVNSANTIDDLKQLEKNGTSIFICGTCANFYGIQDKLAVGSVTDMLGIAEKMASAVRLINI